ncbi:MAG: hypothetical protein ACPGLV_00355 [Bacteroidia bacterium]
MLLKTHITLITFGVSMLISCAQKDINSEVSINSNANSAVANIKVPHQYGGWYCPDNLGGFPAVDIENWKSVPVVNGRMATAEETRNGTALIKVDMEKYPDAKPLDIEMPQLARYYCQSSKKEELIIIIQALNISNDSIVGFRYLNGGNGSARFNEVRILNSAEINTLEAMKFVNIKTEISALKMKTWDVITNPIYAKELQAIFDTENALAEDWMSSAKVNFQYANAGKITSAFANELYGNQYAQIDYEKDDYQYVEKFFVWYNNKSNTTELIITCGPFGLDYDKQSKILKSWATKVKELSEHN